MTTAEMEELAETNFPTPKRSGPDVYHAGDRCDFQQAAFIKGLEISQERILELEDTISVLCAKLQSHEDNENMPHIPYSTILVNGWKTISK